MVIYGDYSIPYVGSKRGIATALMKEMLKYKPNATIFIDLFGGGGAMSFKALCYDFKKVIYNELDTQVYKAMNYVIECINGEHKSKYGIFPENFYRGINRDKWEKLNINNPADWLLKTINSFGTNLNTSYLYSHEIEQNKIDLENYCINPTEENYHKLELIFQDNENLKMIKLSQTPTERRLFMKILSKTSKKNRLQSLQSLESLERLERLERFNNSYECIDLSKYNDDEVIIYCDIPYNVPTTKKLYAGAGEFDYEKFYEWAIKNDKTIFISEYNMPACFTKIFEIKKTSLLGNNKTITECLFCNKKIDKAGQLSLF